MNELTDIALSHDPVHGYIPFVNGAGGEKTGAEKAAAEKSGGEKSGADEPGANANDRELGACEVTERQVIDHPWLQRLRQIHQLQTAWWVYPTAEHTRFQHVLGAMHLASRMTERLYPSLREVCPDAPSRGYVECLMRMAALLHDVGHGPFGHFFDAHFLADYGLTHETLGARIVCDELGDLLRRIRRAPGFSLKEGEQLDPLQIATLITRPTKQRAEDAAAESDEAASAALPRWLTLLRGLFCGIYTVDNMDFVLRDAMMSGYSQRAFDLDRLLHYSFFTERGLTIHQRGVDALVRFMRVRGELFRAIYYHRTVRAIDLTLGELFARSRELLFPGNPLEHLDAYRKFTEWSLLADVTRWDESDDRRKRELADPWRRFLGRELEWRTACERNLVFSAGSAEASSVFAGAELVEQALRKALPAELRETPMRIDLPRHLGRPNEATAAGGQNFLYVAASGEVRPLTDDQLYRSQPLAGRIVRVYVRPETPRSAAEAISAALDRLLGPSAVDDVTNM